MAGRSCEVPLWGMRDDNVFDGCYVFLGICNAFLVAKCVFVSHAVNLVPSAELSVNQWTLHSDLKFHSANRARLILINFNARGYLVFSSVLTQIFMNGFFL